MLTTEELEEWFGPRDEKFDESRRPEDRWPKIIESIERLRPLASEALLALFKQTMADEVEDAFGKGSGRARAELVTPGHRRGRRHPTTERSANSP